MDSGIYFPLLLVLFASVSRYAVYYLAATSGPEAVCPARAAVDLGPQGRMAGLHVQPKGRRTWCHREAVGAWTDVV